MEVIVRIESGTLLRALRVLLKISKEKEEFPPAEEGTTDYSEVSQCSRAIQKKSRLSPRNFVTPFASKLPFQ
jgi:hypothetical protein